MCCSGCRSRGIHTLGLSQLFVNETKNETEDDHGRLDIIQLTLDRTAGPLSRSQLHSADVQLRQDAALLQSALSDGDPASTPS
jgi:hypothetical protein